jgi:glycosyltransferase involved in cell wall biosynthesis
MPTLPHVTCAMTAFNYERYIEGALRSIITQDYPGDLLDVVVVDDGSTDGTADVVRGVQAHTPGRIDLVQQANVGLAGATAAALRHARGELVAICDADDEWLPGKVRDQVDVFIARPSVTCVYGDMQVIDESGAVVDTSFFARERLQPVRGRVLESLLELNFTTNSTLMVRSRCVPRIPVDSPYADYWLATYAAAAGELELIERPLANYRLHRANMSFGADGAHRVRELQRELLIRRMILTSDVERSLSVEALVRIVHSFADKAAWISQSMGVPLAELVAVTSEQRALAERELARTTALPMCEEHLRSCCRAWLLDPFNAAAAEAIRNSTTPTGRRLTLARAGELVAHPELLADYCARVSATDAATLVIVTPDSDLETVAVQLRQALSTVGVDPDNCADLQVVPESANLTGLTFAEALRADHPHQAEFRCV